MKYIDTHNRRRRHLIAIAATLLINGWLIYALLHGNFFPFAAPEHLIRVLIYPDKVAAKVSAPHIAAPVTVDTRR